LLKAAGITVKINTVVIPGVNDFHVPEIARKMAELGADVHNCIPIMHVENTAFAGVPTPDPGDLMTMRFEAGKYLKQISHCARCRADAVGLLGAQNGEEIQKLLADAATTKPRAERPYVAVASREGLFVNQHLGEATGLWVFGLENGVVTLVGRRPTPVPGAGETRWDEMAEQFKDCFAILASGFGKSPEMVLSSRGISLIAAECLITDGAGALLEGRELPRVFLRTATCGAGTSCGGTGMGCA
jgi:nitrogen fixation protein NifB